jgi:hypothetical protein
MRGKKRLTAQEFEVIRPYLERLKDRNVHAIHEILVGGRAQKDVAIELELSRETISQMVRKVWQLHIDRGDRPEGWVSIGVTLPPDLADLVKDMERKAREKIKVKQ